MLDKEESMKAIEKQLKGILSTILEVATYDDSFRVKLETILVEGKVVSRSKKTKPVGKPSFDVVAYLDKNGAEELRKELGTMPNSELDTLLKFDGVKSVVLKKLQRNEKIEQLIAGASRMLSLGSAFSR